ncbi:MAG: 3-oxoacyl-ACP synthase [Methylibium sp. NZG]|nr:MAG: 3-oxoacyl-ACP synthase [Methylibium sp. NZG]
MKVHVRSVGLLGPGLVSWEVARAVLRGAEPHMPARTVLTPPTRLPPAERRRAGDAIKLAMAVADQAVMAAALDPQTLATVFASSSGEGTNCHIICETLASENRLLSPTRFSNSVHNAPSGYWHIAVASRAPSTSLCAFDGSFAAGLLEAATQCLSMQAPVLLVGSDTPYPEPLHATRPLADSFGMAMVLTPMAADTTLASLQIDLVDAATAPPSVCSEASLEFLRAHTPAARALPLLQALARDTGNEPGQALHIEYLPTLALKIRATPTVRAAT